DYWLCPVHRVVCDERAGHSSSTSFCGRLWLWAPHRFCVLGGNGGKAESSAFVQAHPLRQLVAPLEHGPLRFDLDRSTHPGGIVPEAGPWPVFGLFDQAALDGIPMNIADHLTAGL